jgi:toxin-antitoxin system PIN domain toxin
VIAVDTNILVYALQPGVAQHREALRRLEALATGRSPWAIPYPCVAQFLRVVTHRAFRPVIPAAEVWHNMDALLASPTVQLLTPTRQHLPMLRDVINESGAVGDMVYDAQIVTLCLEYGVREILTGDRGFRRFTGIKVTDPFRG